MTDTKAVATTAKFDVSNYQILDPSMTSAFQEAMELNLEGEEINPRKILTTIPMPTGGGTMWSFDSIEGIVDTKEFEGIIVHIQTERALFLGEPKKGEANRPACSSQDGITGTGEPGGVCTNCPDNQFGPNNTAKACKESKIVYILMRGEILPMALRVTPGSFKPLQQYRINLAKRATPMQAIETKFSLIKVDGAFKYSQVVLKPGNKITDKSIVNSITKLKTDLLPFLSGKKAEPAQETPISHTDDNSIAA